MAGLVDNQNILAAANQIVAAINGLHTVIGNLDMNISQTNNNNCCSNCGSGSGSGGTPDKATYVIYPGGGGSFTLPIDPTSSPNSTTSPLGNPNSDPPPDGFATWEEYDIYKCKAAQCFADFIIWVYKISLGLNDFQMYQAAFGAGFTLPFAVSWMVAAIGAGFGAATGTSLLAAVLVGSGGIVVICGLLVVAAALLIANHSTMVSFGDELENRKDELICAMYQSGSAAQAAQDVMAFIQDAATTALAGAPSTVLDVVVNIAGAFLTPVFFDDLFRVGLDVSGYSGGCTCPDQPESFNGWTIPLHSEGIAVEYIALNTIHNGTINPGTEIHLGQFIDGFPYPLHTLDSNEIDPGTIDTYGGVGTHLELISPTFTSQQDAQIIFTIAGGGSGGAGEDAQWHFYTYAGGWSLSTGNYGNGQHTIDIPADATRAIISYVSPFSHSNPLPHVSDIQFVNLLV